ncbi:MAG: hypothetical protein LQ341_007857, partial [Variospora aurantia]
MSTTTPQAAPTSTAPHHRRESIELAKIRVMKSYKAGKLNPQASFADTFLHLYQRFLLSLPDKVRNSTALGISNAFPVGSGSLVTALVKRPVILAWHTSVSMYTGGVTYVQEYCSRFILYLRLVREDEEEYQARSILHDQPSANTALATRFKAKSTVDTVAARGGMGGDQ